MNGFNEWLAQVRKAVTAAIAAGVAAYVAANSDTIITTEEWIYIGIAVVVAGFATWAIPNAVVKRHRPAVKDR